MKLYFQPLQFEKNCVTQRGTDVILPDDGMKMSKLVGVKFIHCCDIHFYDINCAFVGYNENTIYTYIYTHTYIYIYIC